MSGRTTVHETPRTVTDEQLSVIEGMIEAGELYDENELLDIVEDLIATVRDARAVVRLVLETNALGSFAYERGDDQESIAEACRRVVGHKESP